MDYLEHEQIEKVLKYIEEPQSKRYADDKYIEAELNRFLLRDEVVREVDSRIFYPLKLGNIVNETKLPETLGGTLVKIKYKVKNNKGSSEKQLKAFSGILLTAEYNLKKHEMKLISERSQLEEDMEKCGYKENNLKKYEKIRQKTITDIILSRTFTAKLQYALSFGSYINKNLKKIAEYKVIKDAALKNSLFASAKRMTADGLSLTQAASLLGTDFLGIYLTGKEKGFSFKLTSEEEALIKTA